MKRRFSELGSRRSVDKLEMNVAGAESRGYSLVKSAAPQKHMNNW